MQSCSIWRGTLAQVAHIDRAGAFWLKIPLRVSRNSTTVPQEMGVVRRSVVKQVALRLLDFWILGKHSWLLPAWQLYKHGSVQFWAVIC